MFFGIQSRLLLVATVALVIALSYLFFQHRRIQKLKSTSDSYQSLYNLEKDSLRHWKDKKNQSHSESGIGIISNKDIFDKAVAQETLLKDLQNKVKKLEGFRIQSTESKYNFYSIIRDSIITDSVKVKVSTYNDPDGWYQFKQIIQGDSSIVKFNSKDSLVTGIFRGKCQRRILFGLIGTGNRAYKVEIINKNPSSTIIFNKEVYLDR